MMNFLCYLNPSLALPLNNKGRENATLQLVTGAVEKVLFQLFQHPLGGWVQRFIFLAL
jgi:polysaccharide pyruvyl transferase WcaK-like protein